ncbi:MAG TPA: FHA domain-containing protein [Pirellulales bacterium]|nr:FHA domain-containing protein [Pirellulales bacterium]
MEIKLKVGLGKNAGQVVAIKGPTFLIGRAEDCHLRPASETISRHHCMIVVDGSYVAIRDFGSKNGTHVNGQRVAGERELRAGDSLRVGPLEFEIMLSLGELAGKKLPPVQNAKEAAKRTAGSASQEIDVSMWLDDPADQPRAIASSPVRSASETQSMPPMETKRISIERIDAGVPAEPLKAPTVVTTPAAAAPTNPPKRPFPSVFQMPEFEAPPPPPPEKPGRLDKTKVFGKLPIQSPSSTDPRSAAADLLEKMRGKR